jgi:ATP-dependent DNA helicase RecG
MNDWQNKAILLLHKSLGTVPTELNELDWKSGLSNKSERLAQHLSAFANYPGGGILVFGVNSDATLAVISKAEGDEIIQRLGNIARNNLNPPVSIEHTYLSTKGSELLFIHIPESGELPVHIRSSDLFDSYTRSAGQTVRMSRNEVKELIARSRGFSFEEQVAMRQATVDEVLTLLDFESYFKLIDKKIPTDRIKIVEVLENEELVKKNQDVWDIINLGAILFAKEITQFNTLKRKAVRLIVYKSSGRTEAIKERDGHHGYAASFERLIQYIMDQLPSNEVIESALRKQIKMYPEKAIREFVANALIHQDFSVTGAGVLIEIFPDRIEVTNPGVPLVDTNRFIDTAPKSRNESLASLLRRLNICEERGSGIDRAIEAIEAYQLPAPKFERGDDYTRVFIYAHKPLAKMDREDRVRACFQHCVLNLVNNQQTNNQSVRKRFNIFERNYPMASRIIAETIEAGFIKLADPDSNSKKYASYVPFWA